MENQISLTAINIAPCQTHHLYENNPFYEKRFLKVLKFHQPGFAPVKDESGAYHINMAGQPAYGYRFTETFGFYEGLAAVKDKGQWFHILPSGEPAYKARYFWCGNFQNNACVVKDEKNYFYHINRSGQRLYLDNYHYVGDFRDGIAVVQNHEGLYTHIMQDGKLLHNKWFTDLDVYHKGFARAKSKEGWFHIDMKGEAIYEAHYSMVEPFYNGIARVETFYGEIVRIDEQGNIFDRLRQPAFTPFQKLSGEIVGYWKTQTIKAAIDLNLFEYLPTDVDTLSQKININKNNTERLLRALTELNLIQPKGNYYYSTELSAYLKEDHSLSLAKAVIHWAKAHYLAWMHLTEALKHDKAMYAEIFNEPLFDWLDQDSDRLLEYQNAMTSYAKHDYLELIKLIDLSKYQTVIDAGGGQGSLMQFLLLNNPHLHGTLLERKKVVKTCKIPTALARRMQAQEFDLFRPWPTQADAIILSRVLHDWNDDECLTILKYAHQALANNGRLLIIEMLLQEESSNGGMLDMNMLVITGGKERTLNEFQILANKTNFQFLELKTCGNYNIIAFQKMDQ